MAGWKVTAYAFGNFTIGGVQHTIKSQVLQVISGKLTKTLNDTSKVSVTVPYIGMEDFSEPVKTLLKVEYDTTAMFFGTVAKVTCDPINGTMQMDAVGALGTYQFVPNGLPSAMSDFSALSMFQLIGAEDSRFAYNANYPRKKLYEPYGESMIPAAFPGILINNYADMVPSCNINKIAKTAKNCYEYLKTITKKGNYVPHNGQYWVWLESAYNVAFAPVNFSSYNSQEIRYDENLISCTIQKVPYDTKVDVLSDDGSASGEGTNFPITYNYSRYSLQGKSDGTSYTSTELQNECNEHLNTRDDLIEAIAFDRHVVDGSPWLSMWNPVKLIYKDSDGMTKTTSAQINEIVYNFTDSSKDRVRLGKIVETITDSQNSVTEVVENVVKDYVPLSGGEMSGAITYDGGTSLDGNELKIRDRYALTCNIIDIKSLEQGDIDGNTGNNNTSAVGYVRTAYKLPIEPSATYTFSSNLQGHRLFVFEYDSSGAYLGYNHPNDTTGTSSTFTTRSTTAFYRVQFSKNPYSTLTPSEITSLQLEKGNQVSPNSPYTMDGVELTNYKQNKLRSTRVQFERTIGANSDTTFSPSDITSQIGGFSGNRVLLIVPEGARPKTSWAEVHPIMFYNSTNLMWGVHNYGTGGVAIIDFVVVYEDYL